MLAYAMRQHHGRSDDVTDYSKLTLSGGTALYCTITRYSLYCLAVRHVSERKIDTIRESISGNANSPRSPGAVPVCPQVPAGIS